MSLKRNRNIKAILKKLKSSTSFEDDENIDNNKFNEKEKLTENKECDIDALELNREQKKNNTVRGEHPLVYRANDVQDLLGNLAQITGGYDRKGFLFLTILKNACQEEAKIEDVKKVILYLASTRSSEEKQKGFSFLVCLKPTQPFGNVKPITKLLQDGFPFKIFAVYIIKPEKYREKILSSSMASSKYRFEINVVSKENVFTFIAPEELTEDLGGTYIYQHNDWLSMRLAFEKFLFETYALSSKLDDIKRSLLQDDYALTVDGVRDQIQHHQYVRKWIEKAPVGLLAEEGNNVIQVIKNSCKCQNESEMKDEYRDAVIKVHTVLGELKDKIVLLKDLWINRRTQLEQRFQFNLFKQDAEKMLSWINENRTEFMSNYTEIGDNTEYAKELCEEHKQFEDNCVDVQANINAILQVANKLHDMQFFDVELIERLTNKLDLEWEKLHMAVKRRSIMLAASVSFHMKSEEYLEKTKLWNDDLLSIETRSISNESMLNEILEHYNCLKQNMHESYDKVSLEAKSLLSALQRPPANDTREEKVRSRLSDYTEAASHVMDVIVEMYEQNKQLNIQWEKTRCRVHQKYKLYLFGADCDKILKYLKGNGNNFLSKYSWVGDGLEIAEELLADQDEFEKSFQETYLKAKKLLETAVHLAEKKECDPQEIKQKALQIETEVKLFTSKIKKRRELLKMAVSFYKNAQKLTKMTEKLKEDMNLDATSTEPQNFDEMLEKHRHECEATLEKLLSTVQEGENLSAELLQESRVTDKDTRTSWFSTGSNSPEQSRLAVELYLKELNLNRMQLQKLWKGRQQKLDYWVKVKHYERDTNLLYLDVKKWNSSWQKKELSSDFKKASSMFERFENEFKAFINRFHVLVSEGKELEKELASCGVVVTIAVSDNGKVDSVKYVSEVLRKLVLEFDFIKKINTSLRVKYEFTLKQRKLEADAKKVSGWIRHGESILEASLEAGHSLYEAEALLREYERFHVAIETTRLGVLDVCKSSENLIKEGHPDPICIKAIIDEVESKWHFLMKRSEERRAVVFSSYNFYRATDQVAKLLEKFSKDCKSDEDPCSKLSDYDLKHKKEKLEACMKNTEPERKAVEEGCLKVKESSEEFLKNVLPASSGFPLIVDGSIGRLEIIVHDLVEQVVSQETYVLKQLQLRKTVVAGCVEYVLFQEEVEQVLELITDQGTVVSEGFKALDEVISSEGVESSLYVQKQEEYQKIFEDIHKKVKDLLEQASLLINKTHFHRTNISDLANAINMRYKDLALHMKHYRKSLEIKFGYSLPELEDESEWPSLSLLRVQSAEISNVTRRDVSNDSGIHEMTEEKRRSVKRIEFVIKELIQTEKAYVDDLRCCIENFLLPTYNNPQFPEMLQGQQHIIFGNIERIFEFHSSIFLKCLEKYEHSPENVGHAFIDWEDSFHMYVDFCANKPDSNALLIEHGENFFEDLQLKRGLGLSLAAYLIKPVQRITKYQLLLKELVSSCDSDANLQLGLDVMLNVPRRANDAMYLCMIRGFDEGSLESLGKILLQDSFSVWDPKHILKKGKDRHVFLFEQALLFCKEVKDSNGKCTFTFKFKMKTNELGLTEHVAEDSSKFAVWTGQPPFTEEKRIIKAESNVVKLMWVREIRELMQQFQFGMLVPQTSFYPQSPKKGSKNRKSTSVADMSMTSDGGCNRSSGDFDTATICSRTSLENCARTDIFIVTDDYIAKSSHEICLTRGQHVEILSRPPGSRSWRVRTYDEVLGQDSEGMVPYSILRKVDESPMRGIRNSVETLNSQSSEDSYQQDSPKGSIQSISSDSKKRKSTKSEFMSGTLKMRTWARSSGRKLNANIRSSQPSTPTRQKNISGGGTNKLQALLGAPKKEIDLLIRPSDGTYATLGRSASRNTERVKFLSALDHDDPGFQEGDYDSEDSVNDICTNLNGSIKEDSDERATTKRNRILAEMIETEKEYINVLEIANLAILPSMNKRTDIPDDLRGKEKVIFGNIPSLLHFHKIFIKEFEPCNAVPENVASVFLKFEKEFEMYIQYCANKPRSAALVSDYLQSFFNDITEKENTIGLENLLMRPVDRIMKYHSMLKEFTKYSWRSGKDTTELVKALHQMYTILKKADDVMNVGMMSGFPDNLNNQGLLLLQDTVFVADVKAQVLPVEKRVFLFEKQLIFCEPFERKPKLLTYIYRHCIKTKNLGLMANYDEDICKLAIWGKQENGFSEIYVLTTRSPASKKLWHESIRKIIEDQYVCDKVPNNISNENFDHSVDELCRTKISEESSRDNAYKTPVATLQHVKLIPLDEAKSLDDLTKPFAHEKYIVLETREKQNADEISVKEREIVYLVSKLKKNNDFFMVQNTSKEQSGLVPIKILRKLDNENLLTPNSSNDKAKKESSKRSKTFSSSTLLRTASLRRKKRKDKDKTGSISNISEISSPIVNEPKQSTSANSINFSIDSDLDELHNVQADNSLDITTQNVNSKQAPIIDNPLNDVIIKAGLPLKLSCIINAGSPPCITWGFNEKTVTSNDRYNITCTNNLCTFEIATSEPCDSGCYTVTATNYFGSTSCSCNVLIKTESNLSLIFKPIIRTTSSSSVNLEWNPPEYIFVKSYTIQQISSAEWETVITEWHDTIATINGLHSDHSYMFRIVAYYDTDSIITSEPSDPIKLFKETKLTHKPCEIKWLGNIEEHYQICGELGRGRFSVVKRCVRKNTKEEFAAKIFRRRLISKETVESEVAVMQSLNHAGVVKVFEIYEAPKSLIIIQQMLSGGRLFDHIVVMDMLTENLAKLYIIQLLKAVQYIHSLSIAHLDIKPENILLSDGPENIVLSDFGDAIRLRSVPYQHEMNGNPEFLAPEIITGKAVSLLTDMWSIGVVVYVLLSGVSPFFSDNSARLCENITQLRYKFPGDFFGDISDEAKDFIEDLLVVEQSLRPNAKKCLESTWLITDTVNNELYEKSITLSRLAAFNARRHYQYEISNNKLTGTQNISPLKKESSNNRR
ncbi:triple functional domain protein isoform X8 [Hydra vulgaris]|uniref:Triple functional domain protein isoform X8 n=1 Tax=Hydra vulgaris TaxID=6087 RepID=A0ABM4C3W9_HYDVU